MVMKRKAPLGPVSAETLAAHSAFFDRLVELVPARYYVHDDARRELNLRYLKKDAREAAKRAFKEARAANKRARLDPQRAKTTIEVQRQKQKQSAAGSDSEDDSNAASGSDSESEDGGAANGAGPSGAGAASGALGSGSLRLDGADKEQLRERLHKRLQGMRQQRKADERKAAAQAAKDWRKASSAKRRDDVKKSKGKAGRAASGQLPEGGEAAAPASAGAAGARAGASGFEFGNVSVMDAPSWKARREAREGKRSKQQMLKAVEAKMAAKLELAGTEEGRKKEAEDAWQAALRKAAGEKVLDDAKLLKKSIKKETKIAEKKSQAWKERQTKQVTEQKKKQDKRTKNLQKRIDEKKAKKIAKREKKLSRAGFEGRKGSAIN